jgi:hypothetical protein
MFVELRPPNMNPDRSTMLLIDHIQERSNEENINDRRSRRTG